MQNEFPTVETLIDGIKETTNFISRLITIKAGLLITLVVFLVLFSNVLFG